MTLAALAKKTTSVGRSRPRPLPVPKPHGKFRILEPMTQGMEIDEIPTPEQPIGLVASAVTAFVGRALRGPVNTPVSLHGFADYQQVFGGLWQPSPLSYAVEQFFEHGGQHAPDDPVTRQGGKGRPGAQRGQEQAEGEDDVGGDAATEHALSVASPS